jgi:hypothetical protein
MPRSSKSSFSFSFLTKILYTPLLFPMHATCPAPLILDLINRTILGEEYRSLSFSLCCFLHYLLPRETCLWQLICWRDFSGTYGMCGISTRQVLQRSTHKNSEHTCTETGFDRLLPHQPFPNKQ